MMTEAQTASYEGSCHCGAVRFRAKTALDGLAACNCSRCRRLNWVMQPVPAAEFELKLGDDVLTEYRFNRRHIAHLFCARCGIESFARGADRQGNALVVVNVNCLEGARIAPDSVTHWDGASF